MGDPIRILQVVVNMNRGGAETLLMNLYRNIDRSKVQFDFLTCKQGVFDQEIEEMGGKVHRISYISDVGHFGYVKELKKFFTTNRDYKIVHSHMDKMSGLVLREARNAGIPVRISHSHNTQSEGGMATRIYKWYSGQLVLSNATNYFACSKDAAQWMFKDRSSRATLLKNGIEFDQFVFSSQTRSETREELNVPEDVVVLGHVGRFCHQKNHSFLLDIFAKFNLIHESSLLILVGDGPLRSEMEQKAKKLGLEDKVMFLGVRSDINRLLQAFDTFIFPSLHEGLPVSLIEAQGSGLSCIISDQISPEVDLEMTPVDYVPLDNLNVWVDKISNQIRNKFDRHIQSNLLSEKGYDIRETSYKIEKFYLGLTGKAV